MENKWYTEEYLVKVKEKVKELLEITGEKVTSAAKQNIVSYRAVDTGNLLSSVDYVLIDNDIAVQIGTPVEYAVYVELGTYKMSPRPFLRDALTQTQKEIEELFKNAIG